MSKKKIKLKKTKGTKEKPETKTTVKKTEVFPCTDCDFIAKSQRGLTSHMRKHNGNDRVGEGAPTKYDKEKVLKATREYIESCVPFEERRMKSVSANGESWETVVKPNLPSVLKLRRKLGVAKSTIYEWAGKHPEFSDLLEEMVEIQEDILKEYGLSGDLHGNLAKFILSARHDYREKSDHRIETASDLFDDEEDDES